MLLSAVSVLVVAQSSSEIPEGLMNNPVCQHANVSLVLPQYCCQVSPGSYANVPLFSFIVLGARSCGMPHLFSLTVPQQ